jgi:hypothetical protein
MANELRVRQNFIGGLVEDNPLTATATTFQSNALVAVVGIGSTQHFPITFDPDGLYGEPEIAYITAHTPGAVTATILREQEGTTKRQHNQDVPWVHGPTTLDLLPVAQTTYFEATGVGTVGVTGQAFNTVICDNEVTDPSNAYNPTTGIYTVPQTGLYEFEGSWRPNADNTITSVNIGVGIDSANVDSANFHWRTIASGASTNRATLTFRRMGKCVAGDQMRFFTYVDTSSGVTIGARRFAGRLVGV